MRQRNRLVLWPAYFDARKARIEGRRVPRGMAVDDPSVEEIEEAAKVLGMSPEVVKDASYPRSWWERGDLVLVDKRKPKTDALKEIAQRIREARRLERR